MHEGPSISEYMTAQHRECDRLLARAEHAVADGDWDAARSEFEAFDALTRRHLRREEEILFPAFEERTGMTTGPTAVMRMEHDQMRAVLDDMAAALASRDTDSYLGESETSMILTQQHNMKEEQILYGMSDQVLGDVAVELMGRMDGV